MTTEEEALARDRAAVDKAGARLAAARDECDAAEAAFIAATASYGAAVRGRTIKQTADETCAYCRRKREHRSMVYG